MITKHQIITKIDGKFVSGWGHPDTDFFFPTAEYSDEVTFKQVEEELQKAIDVNWPGVTILNRVKDKMKVKPDVIMKRDEIDAIEDPDKRKLLDLLNTLTEHERKVK